MDIRQMVTIELSEDESNDVLAAADNKISTRVANEVGRALKEGNGEVRSLAGRPVTADQVHLSARLLRSRQDLLETLPEGEARDEQLSSVRRALGLLEQAERQIEQIAGGSTSTE